MGQGLEGRRKGNVEVLRSKQPRAYARGLCRSLISNVRVWPVYGGPADILRSVEISVRRVRTFYAEEQALSRTIGLIDATARRAGSGGIAGVYEDDRDTCQPRLVFDKGAKLEERPRVLDASLCLTNSCPGADALQVFQGDAASGVFGLRNQLLGNAVVLVSSKAGFLTTAFLQEPLGRLRAFGLKGSPEPGITVAQPLDRAPGELLPFGIDGDVRNAEVHAEEVFHEGGRRVHRVAGCQEVKIPVRENEVAFSLPGGKEVALSIPTHEGDALPSAVRPDRDFGPVHVPADDPVIVGDGTEGPERALGFFVQFVGVRNFGDAPDHHLSRQAGEGLGLVVEPTMDRVLAEDLVVPRPGRYAVASRVRPFKGFLEGDGLFGSRTEFHLGREFHTLNIRLLGPNVKN